MAARRANTFNYPHSFTGVNNSFQNVPQHDVYPELPRNAEVGDKAQYAHQNVRKFPDWYKPYGFNYQGDGWLCFILGGFVVAGWSFKNDIKEAKGRKVRKIFKRDDLKEYHEYRTDSWAKNRIDAGDKNFTKFLVKKERAAVHH